MMFTPSQALPAAYQARFNALPQSFAGGQSPPQLPPNLQAMMGGLPPWAQFLGQVPQWAAGAMAQRWRGMTPAQLPDALRTYMASQAQQQAPQQLPQAELGLAHLQGLAGFNPATALSMWQGLQPQQNPFAQRQQTALSAFLPQQIRSAYGFG